VEQSRLRVLEPTFFANGAEVGGVRERALRSPTHPLAHRGAWRHRAGRGSSAPPVLFTCEGLTKGLTQLSISTADPPTAALAMQEALAEALETDNTRKAM
jgi:hypothetical protein